MTERPISSGDRSLAGRLALSRLATRVSMTVERGWPLILPLLIVASLFLSLSWLGLFPRLPDIARIDPGRGVWHCHACGALSAAFLQASVRRRGRPPHRSGQRIAAQPGAGADRPTERQGKHLFAGVVARASKTHGRPAGQPWRRPAAHPRAGARPVGAARRGRAAVGHRFCLFLRTVGRQDFRRFPRPRGARCRATAHRCLGDAASLYRQAAPSS